MINFHHIFKEVEDAKTKKDKMVVLHKHSSPSLKLILGATYDPRVEWLLPEGTPPYTPLPQNSDGELDLAGELRKLYLFTKGNTEAQRNLKPERRELIFIQMLESLEPKEAKILIGMKDRKLPYKGITRKLVCDTFQNLTKDWK